MGGLGPGIGGYGAVVGDLARLGWASASSHGSEVAMGLRGGDSGATWAGAGLTADEVVTPADGAEAVTDEGVALVDGSADSVGAATNWAETKEEEGSEYDMWAPPNSRMNHKQHVFLLTIPPSKCKTGMTPPSNQTVDLNHSNQKN